MSLEAFRRAYAHKTIDQMAAEYVLEKDIYFAVNLYEEMTRRTGIERTHEAIDRMRKVSKLLNI